MAEKITPKEYAVTKVIATADKWLDRRQETQALKHGTQRDRVRALGRYEVAGEALAASVCALRVAAEKEKAEADHG